MPFPPAPAVLAARDLSLADLDREPAVALARVHAWMHYSRTLDNRILELFRQGLIKGTVTGGQGHEALIVPLALLADKANDVVCFTHRNLAGHLIWSGHLCDHLNQYFANLGSPTQAREGNIHHGDPANRSLPMISHLGAMMGPVVGMTDSQRRLGRPAVGFAIFGDGGSSTGDIHEALNLASVWSVPVVFIVENNRYAYSTPLKEQYAPNTELWRRAAGYGIEGRSVDGTDPEAVIRVLSEAIAASRRDSRPRLVEAHVLRLRGHAAYDTCDYLQPGEAEGFAAHDPVPRVRHRLAALIGADRVQAVETELNAFIEACIKVSLATPRPDPVQLAGDPAFAPATPPLPWVPRLGSDAAGPEAEFLNYAQGINHALRKILAEQPRSLVLGQDIATYGGAFKVTEHLFRDFGRTRVLNTPLAESACTGYSIGMAVNGHRPIEEFQFADFATEAATQITLNAATFYFRSGAACPLVLRLPTGGNVTLGSFHSQELDSFFLAMPGLKALYPSTPQDAFNAMLAAYEDPNPVLFFEHKALYRRGRQQVGWDPAYRDVWRPKRVRAGDFATFVSYGEMMHIAQEVAEFFAAEYDTGFDLFDLRCLAPLRLEEIEASVARTGRLIVLHEGRQTHGFGAELVARIAERQFAALKAPPLRIASLDLPVPFAPELEAAFRPSRDKVVERITTWMG
ncbi:MAG TPA: thiamine pyrophosphate-dependent enzyme [Opitutaceae bacterium]|jgi:2-oxoisovalerate dehydrogenase E1 component|nr:thiamine pyrophosphate-dependent enzyme [Opitutaceae bacterium]